ncbi:MAG: nucleoside-diphosphate-sugar epimerase [Limisphaerales bacterium]|jgi:nucleoside-diphosphate-sugar epimerase
MRILVSGGNRYIGLELTRELAAAGHAVTVINSHEVALPDQVERIHADRRVDGAFEAALRERRDEFDIFFDNTAFTPADVRPMMDIFQGHLQHYVFTSSQAVYRRSYVLPIEEDFRRHAADDNDPRKAYGVGKVQCEDLLLNAWHEHEFPATCLRVGHTMGPRSPAATRDPAFFARLEAGRPILVPGEGYAVTQLIHINDVAQFMLSLIGNKTVKGEAYNVSGSEYASIIGVIQLAARAAEIEPQIIHVPIELARQQHPPLLHWGESVTGSAVMSIDKARAHTGWAPRYGIESGYRDSYLWHQTEGRDKYEFDFSKDDALIARLSE